MELLLNAIWLAVAAALFLTVRPRTRQVQLALLLAVALLFPIISVSDDAAAGGVMKDFALLMPLAAAFAALIAVARIELSRDRRQFVLLAVQSDPRSPPRR